MPTTIIVPSKFPDIFEEYRRRADVFEPLTKKILVRDGHDIIDPSGWTTIQAEGPFIYSRNVNLGINQTSGDVLLMNDDCCFTREGTVAAMEKILAAHSDIGILSPRIGGMVANATQSNVCRPVQYSTARLAFVCVLIRRAVLDKIGLLDERFTGYGWDDDDFCRRAVDAGFRLACTADAYVMHGHGKRTWSSSFSRTGNSGHHTDNIKIYEQKWGTTHWGNASPVTNRAMVYTDSNKLVTDWWSRH